MALNVDCTFDVNTDVETRRTYMLSLGGYIEEGETCGLYSFGETGGDIEYVPIPGPAGEDGDDADVENIFVIPLGEDPTLATGDPSAWAGGKVTLTPADNAGYAISEINKALALAATQADLDAIQDIIDNLVFEAVEMPLGDDLATDGTSLWDDGAVTLTADTSTAQAISLLSLKIAELMAQPQGPQHGFDLILGPVETEGDGSWSPGAVPLTNSTTTSEAIDRLNEVLAKLVPSPPSEFPNATLSLANGAGTSPRLASGGVADNSDGGSGYDPGDAVNRITAAGFSSNTFNDAGPGDSGTLAVLLNDAIVVSRALTGSGDNGNYAGLVISDQKDYPVATPGFWKSFDAALTLVASPVGINKIAIDHDAAGTTNAVYYVRDGMTSAPAVSAGTVDEETAGTYAYSSSIPHYGTGGQLAVNAAMTNLAGETYYGGADPFVISGTNSIFSSKTCSFTDLAITVPIPRQTTTATAIAEQIVDVNGTNVHNSGLVQGTGRNVNGSSAATSLSTKNVLVKRGSAGARIDETAVTVTGLGSSPNSNNAVRVGQVTGDKPAGVPAAWVQNAALATHEATVVGGVLKHDQTNYATGYLPAGPNLSAGRTGAQYVTFSFKRTALSAFKIAVTGTYAGVWVKLPGVTDQPATPNNTNGWMDAFKAYDGAGAPGETGDTDAGCALGTVMSGASGTFQMTFGTLSSTNATDNEILVRIRLTAGQQITALSFTN